MCVLQEIRADNVHSLMCVALFGVQPTQARTVHTVASPPSLVRGRCNDLSLDQGCQARRMMISASVALPDAAGTLVLVQFIPCVALFA